MSFTFDGFPSTAAAVGARLLDESGVRGTFYTAPGMWGKDWLGETVATAEEVDALDRAGHEIGCQPFSGRPVDRMSRRDLEQEVSDSIAAFRRDDQDRRFSTFAFTEGRPTASAKREMGRRFAACRGMNHGVNLERADLAMLRSVELTDQTVTVGLLDHLLEVTHDRSGWLIFRSRGVTEDPSLKGCSPSLLELAINRSLSLEMTVFTVRAALGRITNNN